MSAVPLRPPETSAAEFERRASRDRLIRFLLAHLLAQENRIRALEGRAAVTVAVFRNAVKQAFEAA